MRSNVLVRSIAAAVVLFSLAGVAHAQEGDQTSWLELVKGPNGEIIGAELVEIQPGDSDDMQKITVAIPKSGLGDRDEIEEVLVIGQRPPEPEKPKPIEFTYEWVADYDNDNYGLVIRLGKDTNWPIRLYMNSEAGFVD
ncbi:Uncharacterised protein [Halioglobus japonicus]|nr:Uncharacterised protein [Halioglobus japonicus]